MRTHIAEECKNDYAAQLQRYNKEQNQFYFTDMPLIFNVSNSTYQPFSESLSTVMSKSSSCILCFVFTCDLWCVCVFCRSFKTWMKDVWESWHSHTTCLPIRKGRSCPSLGNVWRASLELAPTSMWKTWALHSCPLVLSLSLCYSLKTKISLWKESSIYSDS